MFFPPSENIVSPLNITTRPEILRRKIPYKGMTEEGTVKIGGASIRVSLRFLKRKKKQ